MINTALGIIYGFGYIFTFVYLTFISDYDYNAWNWAIAIPVNLFISAMWPIYWAILHWFF